MFYEATWHHPDQSQSYTFNPQTASGGLRGPGTHPKLPVRFNFRYISTLLLVFLKNIVWNIPLQFYEYVAKKSAPSDIGIKASPKGPKWASQAQVLFSASGCLCCWQPNGTSLKDNVYMSSRIVCHKEYNWSAMATSNIFDATAASTSRLKWPRFENHTKGPTWPFEAYIAFVLFMKNVQSILTHIHLYWSFLVLYLLNQTW